MRVITGRFKGRRLTTVRDRSVRPAADRVKQTIFDILAGRIAFDGITVLDLFAGSGSLGIEALSRGAGHVVFVEHHRAALDCIRRNLSDLGCQASATLLERDALLYAEETHDSFDLIFADPPYLFDRTADLPPILFSREVLRRNGYLLIEHTRTLSFGESDMFRIDSSKRFGSTIVTFFSYPLTGGKDNV